MTTLTFTPEELKDLRFALGICSDVLLHLNDATTLPENLATTLQDMDKLKEKLKG